MKIQYKGLYVPVFELAFDGLDNSKLLEFVILCWKCWFNRNLFVHGHQEFDCEADFSWAAAFVSKCQAASAVPSPQNNPPANSSQNLGSARPLLHQWVPPNLGFLKLNVDGGYCASKKIYSWEATIRDDEGVFMAATIGPFLGCSDNLYFEGKAF